MFTCLSGKLRTEFTSPIANCTSPQANWTELSLPGGGGGEGVLGFMFAGYVPLASLVTFWKIHLPYQCGFKQRNVMRSMQAYC